MKLFVFTLHIVVDYVSESEFLDGWDVYKVSVRFIIQCNVLIMTFYLNSNQFEIIFKLTDLMSY